MTAQTTWLAPRALHDVRLSDSVTSALARHRQTHIWKREAGGQLFGRVDGQTWHVLEATGPKRADFRSRFSFVPDRAKEQREIDKLYLNDLHFLGDWHSHRERKPTPSQTDIASMQDMTRQSESDYPGFLLVIVGITTNVFDWHISFHDGTNWSTLH